MNSILTYEGYDATVEYDEGSHLFCGSVDGMCDGVYFEAESFDGLERAFREVIDDYLAFCEEEGKVPGRW